MTSQIYFLARRSGGRVKRKAKFTKNEVAAFNRDGWVCHYCGSKDNLVTDHVIPKSSGGSNEPGNLVAACFSCNASKGAKPYHDFVFHITAEKVAYEMFLMCGGDEQ